LSLRAPPIHSFIKPPTTRVQEVCVKGLRLTMLPSLQLRNAHLLLLVHSLVWIITSPSVSFAEAGTYSSSQQRDDGRRSDDDDLNNNLPYFHSSSSLNENGKWVAKGEPKEEDFKPPNIVVFILHDLVFFYPKNDEMTPPVTPPPPPPPPSTLNELAEKGIILNLYYTSPYSAPSRALFKYGKHINSDFRYQDQQV
jgi:hypothetical protein